MQNQAAGPSATPQFYPQPGQEWANHPEEIASAVSYELRTPLTVIRASLGLILADMCGTLSQKGQRLLEIALNNTDRLLKLAETLEQEPDLLQSGSRPDPESPQSLPPLSRWQQSIYYDRLTGLPTQRLWLSHLEQALATLHQDSTCGFAVLVLGLDQLQVINDSLGHAVGDQLLMAIAQRLLTCLPPGTAIARLTSDKFAILLETIQEIQPAVSLADTIQHALATPVQLADQDVFTTASIGITWAGAGEQQPEDWLHDAEMAMHRARTLGGDQYTVFEPHFRLEANSRLRLETELRLALERQEFRVHYQPIMDLKKGTLDGFEALVRWHHPEQGLLPPAKFIPLAEETGLIVGIGQWVMREACQQLRNWQQQFPLNPPLTMSVNLSTQQLAQPELIDQIQGILQDTSLAPNCLKLEITESAIMAKLDQAISTLQQLKALGLKISIDDFGTGYSSLAYLYQFPIDTLKIDRSFISRMDTDFEHLEIVKTIVQLAWNLGMDVIAEGAETKQQTEQLRMLGCDFGQGYFFSKPVDSQTAERLVSELSNRSCQQGQPR
jgi:diguanylate cyclase (GGDEF)-like protein